jgi:hypothetical protein
VRELLRRHKLLASTLALALAASVVLGRERPSLEMPEPARLEPRVAAHDGLDLDRLEGRAAEAPQNDPFARRSFAEPPVRAPQRARAQVAEKPTAPPLPFRYLGKIIDEGKLAVFLARGEESLSVEPGQTVGEYRIDQITENEIRFTYLPLKTKQSLPL